MKDLTIVVKYPVCSKMTEIESLRGIHYCNECTSIFATDLQDYSDSHTRVEIYKCSLAANVDVA